MSSDDSGFDKEAEREKLREKYEQDEKDRENTRRMSELLLQGATMTGKHCSECGDPIFRYDGQEFCPTCQQAAESGTAGGAGAEGGATEGGATEGGATESGTAAASGDRIEESPAEGSDPGAGRRAASDGDQSGESDDEPRVEIEGVRVADRHADQSDLRRPPSKQGGDDRRDRTTRRHPEDSRAETTDRRSADQNRQQARDARDGAASGPGGVPARDERASGAGDLTRAREALVRTLTDLARRAEETDDVTRARELLAATREAADALAALDRANH